MLSDATPAQTGLVALPRGQLSIIDSMRPPNGKLLLLRRRVSAFVGSKYVLAGAEVRWPAVSGTAPETGLAQQTDDLQMNCLIHLYVLANHSPNSGLKAMTSSYEKARCGANEACQADGSGTRYSTAASAN